MLAAMLYPAITWCCRLCLIYNPQDGARSRMRANAAKRRLSAHASGFSTCTRSIWRSLFSASAGRAVLKRAGLLLSSRRRTQTLYEFIEGARWPANGDRTQPASAADYRYRWIEAVLYATARMRHVNCEVTIAMRRESYV